MFDFFLGGGASLSEFAKQGPSASPMTLNCLPEMPRILRPAPRATLFILELPPGTDLRGLQGYLAHKKQRPPRTPQKDYA